MLCHATAVAATPQWLVFGPQQTFGRHNFFVLSFCSLFYVVLRGELVAAVASKLAASATPRRGPPHHGVAT
jgi:hypothetical protein